MQSHVDHGADLGQAICLVAIDPDTVSCIGYAIYSTSVICTSRAQRQYIS
jgi:hypothetical protein